MILQALYEYYQRKAVNCDITPMGFEWKEISFLIVIDQKGNLINFEDTRSGEGRQTRATTFLVIKSKGRTGKNAHQKANILWDHYGYVLGHPEEGKKNAKDIAGNQNKTFLKLVADLSEKFPLNEQFRAVKNFLEKKEEIQKVFESSNWKECCKIKGCNLSFKLVGEIKIVAEHRDLKFLVDAIDEASEGSDTPYNESKEGICLITGKKGPISILHTATSIPGGKSGGKLVGFQKNSGYDSYYKKQGLNAPVSKVAEDAYTAALKLLLGRDSKNKFHISENTVVFWAEKETGFESGFSFLFDRPPKDDPDRNSQEVKAFFESIHSGKLNPESDTRFYILGLSPNAARIAVRFWRTGKIKAFAESIALHFSDLEMARSNNTDNEYFTLFTLLTQIAFEYKLDNIPSNLIPTMIESILDGTPYPATLQQQCIRRIRADLGEKTNINRIRAAILKAYLNRKNRIYNVNEKQITMALDLENTNQAYRCGRLFAILEKIQEEAQPGINTTIKARFYGAASTTPVTVFGKLLSLSNHHLSKLNPGRRTNLEKAVQEILSGIYSTGMPKHLSLDDQSRFAIGYYHQRQDLFTKKESN
jgi:CRISPR-associated protein Csd1